MPNERLLRVESLEQRCMLSVNSEVLDINTFPDLTGAGGGHIAAVNGGFVFSAHDGFRNQLWWSNGTPDNIIRLTPASNQIQEGSGVKAIVGEINGVVIFGFQDTFGGDKVWRTDGTPEGTYFLEDAATDPNSSLSINYQSKVAIFNNNLYFVASSDLYGQELWKTDGTLEGTNLVKDIRPGTAGSFPLYLASYKGALYFETDDGVHGRELWISDGTESGTTLFKDINVGTSSSSPALLTVIDDTLFFSADDGVHGRELWSSDGTAGNTQLLKDINAGAGSSNPNQLNSLMDKVVFSANDGQSGTELWISDGTSQGTQLVKDINAGTASSSIGSPFVRNDKIYFTANNGSNGTEPWVSDGTAAGTQLVRDLLPGSGSSSAGSFFAFDDAIYFSTNITTGYSLWTTDGTTAGTRGVAPFAKVLANSFVKLGDKYYFRGAGKGSTNFELWSTDFTLSGTQRVLDVRSGSLSGVGFDAALSVVANQLVFRANDGIHGPELWVSDGTPAGTEMLVDAYQATQGSYSGSGPNSGHALFATEARLWFAANDGVHGIELWTADKYGNQRRMVRDINPGPASTTINRNRMTLVDDLLYFTANGSLWRSDGTEEGTFVLLEGIDLTYLSDNEGILYFLPYGGDLTGELWRTDGTVAGTQYVGEANSSQNYFQSAVIGDKLYFVGRDSASRYYLWVSDGTATGTQLVIDFEQDFGASEISELAVFQGKFCFSAESDGVYRIWQSDGTIEGTMPLLGTIPGIVHTFGPLPAGNKLYFIGYDEAYDNSSLWGTQGTPETTIKLSDLSGYPAIYTAIDGILYYENSVGGVVGNSHLYRSDGTAEGTEKIGIPEPGMVGPYSLNGLHMIGDALYVVGAGGAYLHRIDKTSGDLIETSFIPGGISSQIVATEAGLFYSLRDTGQEAAFGREIARLLPPLPGDADGNQRVDGSDLAYWTQQYGQLSGLQGDFDQDGDVDGRDFLFWQRFVGQGNLGAVDLARWSQSYGNRGVLTSDFDLDGDIDGRDFLAWQRGYGSYRDDHGDEASTASTAQIDTSGPAAPGPSPVTGRIDFAADHDVLKIEVKSGIDYHFTATPQGSGEVTLQLVDSDGLTILAEDINGGAGTLSWTADATKVAYLVLQGYASSLVEYEVSMIAGDDHADQISEVFSSITEQIVVRGYLHDETDVDTFAFEVTQPGAYQVRFLSSTGSFPAIVVSDGQGTEQRGTSEWFDFEPNQVGTFYVSVEATSESFGSYAFVVTKDDLQLTIAADEAIEAAINSDGDFDYFYFNATSGTNYLLETRLGTLQDTQLFLYDSSLNLLRYNDNGPLLSNGASSIEWQAPATGEYIIVVASFPDMSGSYTLAVSTDDHSYASGLTTPLSIPGTIGGTISSEADVDPFLLEVVAGTTYRFTATPITLTRAFVLLVEDGSVLSEYSPNIGEPAVMDWTASFTGTISVLVAGEREESGTYEFSVSIISGITATIVSLPTHDFFQSYVIDVPTEASDWDDEPSVSELEGLAFSEKSLAPWLQPNPTFPEQAFIDEVMNLRRPQDVAVKLRDQAFAEFTENDRWQLETSFGKN